MADHYHLQEDDICYHIWEYVKGGSYQEHPSNQLIFNFQIAPSHRGTFRWRHKQSAIQHVSASIATSVGKDLRDYFTWVPVPPSSIRGDANHDPRLLEALLGVRPPLVDVRELVVQTQNSVSKEKDVSPEDRAARYRIAEELVDPEPHQFIVFDDVIAGGSHFKAMKIVLQRRFPNSPVIGLFAARTVRPPDTRFQIDLEQLLANWKPNSSQ